MVYPAVYHSAGKCRDRWVFMYFFYRVFTSKSRGLPPKGDTRVIKMNKITHPLGLIPEPNISKTRKAHETKMVVL